MEVHENIMNGFQVIELTQFCDGQTDRQIRQTDRQQTDRQTDRQTDGWRQITMAKTIYLSNLNGEDITIKVYSS